MGVKFQVEVFPGNELARVLLADLLLGANLPRSEKAVNPKKVWQW